MLIREEDCILVSGLKVVSKFAALTLALAGCAGGARPPGQAIHTVQPGSLQPPGVWDSQPHSLNIDTVTPTTRCEFNFKGKDGTYVGMGNAYSLLLFVVARSGQLFPETTFYDVVLQSPQNRLALKMRADAGRNLVTPMSFANDPNHLLGKILQSGFTLTVSNQNAGTVLAEQIPSPGPIAMLPFQVCLNMVQSKLQKAAGPKTATP
jgi:hypothetical protein